MNTTELHAIIRQAFLDEYGQHTVPAGASRFAAGADTAAQRIIEAMQHDDHPGTLGAERLAASDLGVSYGNRGPNESEHNAGDTPPAPDAGTARTHDPEPAPLAALRRNVTRCIEEGAPTIEEIPAHETDPFFYDRHDHDRITSLAAETARHEAGIGALGTVLANHSRTLDDLGARISAVEHLTHNTTELAREIRDLRATVSDHSTDLATLTGNTEEAQVTRHVRDLEQDDDQRLGGHDQPHPQPPEDA